MARVDKTQVFLYDRGGETVEVPHDERWNFLRANPGAQQVGLYDLGGGEEVIVARSDYAAFRKANPDAERLYVFDDGGEKVKVAHRYLRAYVASKAGEPEKPVSALGAAAEGVREGIDNIRGVLDRPVKAGERAIRSVVAAPVLLGAQIGEAAVPRTAVDVISGERERLPDELVGAPTFTERAAARVRAWKAREDAKAAPRNL
ncbi:MAG: hypothetical protein IJ678_06665, partial [Kiritimatiellae bacterium]|nr:hypothetical protein [Kiritimatiellia bacterium]